MYRQIEMHPADWDFQRILWKEGQTINSYQLTIVTYGLACAPFLALRTLLQLVRDEGHRFPLVVDALTKGRYVDDIFGGAHTIEEAQQTAYQVDKMCLAGGFPLRKWISNHPDILHSIPPEHQITSAVQIKDTTVQALGLLWTSSLDRLRFHFAPAAPTSMTKRLVLSRIAQFFDPLGLLSPVFIQFKIFMQELWSLKLDWDTQLSSAQLNTWHRLTTLLEGVDDLDIPRWVGCNAYTKIEIHGFSDASQRAMAASIYIKTTSSSTDVNVVLLYSKTKVAPLKRMTIPRLELSAAVMLTKLISRCKKVMNIEEAPCYLWTDSSIVHTWVNNHPKKHLRVKNYAKYRSAVYSSNKKY